MYKMTIRRPTGNKLFYGPPSLHGCGRGGWIAHPSLGNKPGADEYEIRHDTVCRWIDFGYEGIDLESMHVYGNVGWAMPEPDRDRLYIGTLLDSGTVLIFEFKRRGGGEGKIVIHIV